MHGCSGGGHAWLLWKGGACMVALGGGGHAWLLGGMRGCSWGGGMCGCSGGCMVAVGGCMVALGGMCGCSRGHAWLLGGHAWDMTRYGDTVIEQAVRILLECILVGEKRLKIQLENPWLHCNVSTSIPYIHISEF